MKHFKFIAPVQNNLVQEISKLMDDLHLCTSTTSSEEHFRTQLRALLLKHKAHSKKLIPELIVWLNSLDARKYAQINRDFTIRVLFDEKEKYYRDNEYVELVESTNRIQGNTDKKVKPCHKLVLFVCNILDRLKVKQFFASTRRRTIAVVENEKYRRKMIKEINRWVDDGPRYRMYVKKLLQVTYRVCIVIWPALTLVSMKWDLVTTGNNSKMSDCDEIQNST